MREKYNIRLKVLSINFLLLILTIFIFLIIGEGVLRLKLKPVDYLMPYLEKDTVLGNKVKPNSAGHDSMGYRNEFVPKKADVVAIGDSQTYGVSANSKNSWPAQLGKLIGKKVYNISLGGYGPVQYYYLLKNQALILNPSVIIVGFYLGNDLMDTYRIVYTNDYWGHLRNKSFMAELMIADNNTIDSDRRLDIENNKIFGDIRDWLAHHSIFYRALKQSFGYIFRYPESIDITIFEDKSSKLRIDFTPSLRFGALNISDPKIKEGLRISLDCFLKMYNLCKINNIIFIVVLFPTKENVYSKYIENNKRLKNSNIINELLINENIVNGLVKSHFIEHKIPYIDVLEPLRSKIGEQIYPSNWDGHPNKNGYEIVAKSIEYYLETIKVYD